MSPATTPASSVRDDEWEALRCAHMQHMLPPAGFWALLCCALAHRGCCVPGAVILLLRSNTTFSRRPTTQRSCAAQIRASWRGWVRARKKRKSFGRGTFALYDSLSPRQRGVGELQYQCRLFSPTSGSRGTSARLRMGMYDSAYAGAPAVEGS